MIPEEIINKMDANELRNYLYQLQNYTESVREINKARKKSEDTLIYLLDQLKDLSILSLIENNQMNQLASLTEEIKHKYL